MQYARHALTLIAALIAAAAAHAQPAPTASQPSGIERAQHDADKVFRMILQQSDKPRRVVRDDAKPVPAAMAAPVPARPVTAKAVPTPSPGKVAASAAPQQPTTPQVTASTPPAVVLAEPAAREPSVAAPDVAAAPAPSLAPVAVATPRSLKLDLVSSIEPEFPSRLVRQLGKGSVTVSFQVVPDGSVGRTEVTSSSHRGLNDAAMAAVAAWRFKPISETMPGVVELRFE